VRQQVNLPEEPISQQVDVGSETKAECGGRATSQPPKMGAWQITKLVWWDWGQYTKLNYPDLLGEELTSQSCISRATQLWPGENNNRSDQLAQTGGVLPQVPIAVDRKNKILSKTTLLMRLPQSSHLKQMTHKTKESGGKNPSAISPPGCPTRGEAHIPTQPNILSANTKIGCQRNKSRSWPNWLNFFIVFAVAGFFFP
jgi:hypothetical protein